MKNTKPYKYRRPHPQYNRKGYRHAAAAEVPTTLERDRSVVCTLISTDPLYLITIKVANDV